MRFRHPVSGDTILIEAPPPGLGNDPRVNDAPIVLQHTPTEGPERRRRRCSPRAASRCETRALYAGAPVPDDVGAEQLLIVMGGPMGVADAGSAAYPFLAAEIALLRKARRARRARARASAWARSCWPRRRARASTRTRAPGRTARRSPAREVGWGAGRLCRRRDEPALAGLPRAASWCCTGTATRSTCRAGAVHLASTPVCRHQAYRLGRRQFGLQFHRELERETIAVWVREDADYVRGALGPEGGARILADTDRLYASARPIWDRLLGNIISIMQ